MNTKTAFLRLFAIAAVATFSLTACKKTPVNNAPDNNGRELTTVSSRMANPEQRAQVTLTYTQIEQAKKGQPVRLLQSGDRSFVADGLAAEETGSGIGSIGGGLVFNPGNCPPVSAATLQYYQNQANACCCSFAVCLLGEGCYYYFYAFTPSNGCSGGGGPELQ